MAKVKALVGDQLKDPWSAHYRNVRLSGEFICGEVNAKGGSGGYTGFTPFLIRAGQKKALVISQSDLDDDAAGEFYRGIAAHILVCTSGGEYAAE